MWLFRARAARGAMESDPLQPPGRRGAGGPPSTFSFERIQVGGGAPRGTGSCAIGVPSTQRDAQDCPMRQNQAIGKLQSARVAGGLWAEARQCYSSLSFCDYSVVKRVIIREATHGAG